MNQPPVPAPPLPVPLCRTTDVDNDREDVLLLAVAAISRQDVAAALAPAACDALGLSRWAVAPEQTGKGAAAALAEVMLSTSVNMSKSAAALSELLKFPAACPHTQPTVAVASVAACSGHRRGREVIGPA